MALIAGAGRDKSSLLGQLPGQQKCSRAKSLRLFVLLSRCPAPPNAAPGGGMTSARKLEANRRNARASTGPRTAAGKARAAQNARRHGLSLAALCNPSCAGEVEVQARVIAGADAGPQRLGLARAIAGAQVDVVRARRARLAIYPRALEGDGLARLAALDRYEGRALSRRNAAIRVFDSAMHADQRAPHGSAAIWPNEPNRNRPATRRNEANRNRPATRPNRGRPTDRPNEANRNRPTAWPNEANRYRSAVRPNEPNRHGRRLGRTKPTGDMQGADRNSVAPAFAPCLAADRPAVPGICAVGEQKRRR